MKPNTDRYVVQAFSNADGWQNTKHTSNVRFIAERLASQLLMNERAWMPGNYERKVRIHERA